MTAADGTTTLETGKLDKPLTFFAYLVGDRPGSYAERIETATIDGSPVELTIRGWADDAAWADRVGGLVSRGLPVLAQEIGLPWPRQGGLAFHETVSRSTGGYAGLFDPSLGQVEVAYDAGDFVVLHESAHTWFNGGLLTDRWANEAFASYYGLEAAKELKIKASADTLTPELEAARIPLNAWGAVGRENEKTEDYAYAATLALARAIAERAGADGLRAVWADAAGKVGAYQPVVTGDAATSGAAGARPRPRPSTRPPDWRALLDLLEERTGVCLRRPVADMGRARHGPAAARRPPRGADRVRRGGRGGRGLAAAAGACAMRCARGGSTRRRRCSTTPRRSSTTGRTITTDAAAAGLTVPDTLRTAFESPDGFADADARGDRRARGDRPLRGGRRSAADRRRHHRVDRAVGHRTPTATSTRARTLFASGDLAGSARRGRRGASRPGPAPPRPVGPG